MPDVVRARLLVGAGLRFRRRGERRLGHQDGDDVAHLILATVGGPRHETPRRRLADPCHCASTIGAPSSKESERELAYFDPAGHSNLLNRCERGPGAMTVASIRRPNSVRTVTRSPSAALRVDDAADREQHVADPPIRR